VPEREFAVHRAAYVKGLSVPMPLGVCWGRVGPLYRGSIAVAELEDAQHLLDYVSGGIEDSEDTLRRSFEKNGVPLKRFAAIMAGYEED